MSTGHGPAFMLVELIAVIVIVAILSGVAAVSFQTLDDRDTRFAARETARRLHELRQRAQSMGRSVWVTFDVAGNTIEMREDDPANPGFAGSTPLIDPMTGGASFIDVAETFGAGVSLSEADFDGESTIGFNWIGAPILDDDAPLSDQGIVSFNGSATITVHPDTGYISQN